VHTYLQCGLLLYYPFGESLISNFLQLLYSFSYLVLREKASSRRKDEKKKKRGEPHVFQALIDKQCGPSGGAPCHDFLAYDEAASSRTPISSRFSDIFICTDKRGD